MTANELRMGNWVLISGKPEKVESISDEGINYFSNLDYRDDYYDDDNKSLILTWISNPEPIPITPEILEKAGLTDLNTITTNGGEIFYELVNYELGICGKDSAISGHIYYAKCRYVHQLQNLYFALTGEELEIKL